MSERLIAVIDQPCVLCEETLELWRVYKDEDQGGQERIEKEDAHHVCTFMAELVAERYRTRRTP